MSKIQVDTIVPNCGTNLNVGEAGDTVVVAGNIVKSNALQAADGGNIVCQTGTTVTLGASGDSIALAAGATQSGFGRTGTVDWVTTPKVTGDSPITAVTGKGYFLNTTAGTITINLPAGAAGSIVSMADYAGTWQTNNVTVSPNGAEKIGSFNNNATLSTEGQSVTFVYVDSTQGWINTMDSTSNVRGVSFITATVSGACNTLATAPCCANVKIATFLGPGTFCVSGASSAAANNVVSYMVIAGGGGGSADGVQSQGGGGGGAGGYREVVSPTSPYTGSPLDGYATPANRITVAASPYSIAVGGGGGGSTGTAAPGVNSTFSTITSAGGGRGGYYSGGAGLAGGSGGGGGAGGGGGGAGNTPPVSPSQGNSGSPAPGSSTPGAGGGAICAGSGQNGGAGTTTSITASPVARAGGGSSGTGGSGGAGGGGARTVAGTVNTGSGGGGGSSSASGGNGGSGIVIIRYKFQ